MVTKASHPIWEERGEERITKFDRVWWFEIVLKSLREMLN